MRVKPLTGSVPAKSRGPVADHGSEAWVLLLRLLREDQSALMRVWTDFDLSSAQGELLCSLEPDEPVTMVSLARSLHCHDSNVTGLVDKLEQRGLIERRGDLKDRRVKLIALTKEGNVLRHSLLERLSIPLPFIAVLSSKDKTALRNILVRAAEVLKSRVSER
jgi:DNA-binding MarR family transcriptional regulator